MGEEFVKLHELQKARINSRKKGKSAAFARKTLSLSVVASWAYAAGLLQKSATELQKHYALGNAVSPSDDPLNTKALNEARYKGKDPDTYRGLGNRIEASELGRMLEVFLLQAEKGSGITLQLANAAIQSYEAKKMTYIAEEAKRKI